ERADFEHVSEELGDLLFQVVFYARLAEEEGRFEWADIVDGIVRKLLRRHPHVFPDGTLTSRRDPDETPEDAEIRANWDAIKAEEKGAANATKGVLDTVSEGLPELVRARKLQKAAAKVGFDWPEIAPVFDKLHEEIDELREAHAEGNQDAMEDELGDLLFVCVNLSRFMNVDPGQALRRANRKFAERFRHVEARVRASGRSWDAHALEDLEAWWEEAKAGKPPA
ncbi:MAG: nucleoside triphosphate pyrophosphohydrolase, partial [Gammaproteobacteria bacterium]